MASFLRFYFAFTEDDTPLDKALKAAMIAVVIGLAALIACMAAFT